jgi:tRNA(fMet)-specific endonuclease VapC
MSFLLDTDTCSAHLKRPSGLMHRFVQHSGGLCIPTVVLGELYAWAYHRQNPGSIVQRIENDLLPDVAVLDFDLHCAKEFGRVRGLLLRKGISVSKIDLLIASVALVHNLTVVTHNTADYQNVPGLRLEDWLIESCHSVGAVPSEMWRHVPVPQLRAPFTRRASAWIVSGFASNGSRDIRSTPSCFHAPEHAASTGARRSLAGRRAGRLRETGGRPAAPGGSVH